MSIKKRISRLLGNMPPLPEKPPAIYFLINGRTDDGLTMQELERMKPQPVIFVCDGIVKDAD